MHQPPYPENTWTQPSPREYAPVEQNEQRDLPSPLDSDNYNGRYDNHIDSYNDNHNGTYNNTHNDSYSDNRNAGYDGHNDTYNDNRNVSYNDNQNDTYNDNLHQPHPVQSAWSPTTPREYKAVPQNAWPVDEDRGDSPPPLKHEGPSSELPKSDYRPIALRWQFIILIILAIAGIMGGVSYAIYELKGTDSTAKLDTRSMNLQGSFGIVKRTTVTIEIRDIEALKRELAIMERQDSASEAEAPVASVAVEPTKAEEPVEEPAEEPSQQPADDSVTEIEVKPSPEKPTEESKESVTEIDVKPSPAKPTEKGTTEDKTEPSPTEDDSDSSPTPTEDDSDSSPTPTDDDSDSSPTPTEDDSDSSPTATDDSVTSPTPTDTKGKKKPTISTDKDGNTVTPTITDDDDTSATATGTDDDDEHLATLVVEEEYTRTLASSALIEVITTDAVVTETKTVASEMVFSVAGYTTVVEKEHEPGDPQGLVPQLTTIVQPPRKTTQMTYYETTEVQTIATEQSSFGPPVTYVETGTTRLTSVFYIDDKGNPIKTKAVTQLKTSEVPATVKTIVETPPVETILQTQADGQVLTILSTPLPTTRVTSVGPTKVVVTDVSKPTGNFRIVKSVTTYTLTGKGYFVGKFLPPIVAVLLAMALRTINQAARQFQPFAALSRPDGALGKDALTLRFDGLDAITLPFKLLANSQPLPFITALTAWVSSLIAPLASEAIGLKIHGRCRKGSFGGCALELGISERSAYGLLALLVAIAGLLIATIVVISRRWSTGVAANPWCSANAAALMARNPDLRALPLHDYRVLKDAVVDKRFKMGTFRNYEGRDEYGVVLYHGDSHGAEAYGTTPLSEDGPRAQSHRAPQTFAALTFWYRFLFALYLACLLAFVCYYHFVDTFGHLPKGLKDAMSSSGFGVRFACSAIGVSVILLWEMLFTSVAAITPFRRMADKSQSPTRSVLMTPPTNAVSGLFVALRAGDLLLFLTAVASLMAEFLPILFANVPYSLTQTQLAHQVCSRLSAGLLVFMVIGLVGSLFVQWPDLPVDPRSLVGAMWYVAEAPWVAGVEGVAGMNAKARKNKIQGLGGRWSYGYVQATQGRRLAIEHETGYR